MLLNENNHELSSHNRSTVKPTIEWNFWKNTKENSVRAKRTTSVLKTPESHSNIGKRKNKTKNENHMLALLAKMFDRFSGTVLGPQSCNDLNWRVDRARRSISSGERTIRGKVGEDYFGDEFRERSFWANYLLLILTLKLIMRNVRSQWKLIPLRAFANEHCDLFLL